MVDYTTASGYVTDDKGRRQYVDRSDAAGVQGTYLLASDRNQDRNAIMDPIITAGLSGNAADDTLLTQAIRFLCGEQVSVVNDKIVNEATLRANADALLQPLLGFIPAQQGGGFDQVAGKVYLGRDTTYPGLRYSYVNTSGDITTGGYLLSTYGTELNGAYGALGDLSYDGNHRLVYQSYSMNGTYYTAALYSDITAEATARAAAVTSEATARANADAQLVSGTSGMVSGDAQGTGLHYSGTGRMYASYTGGGGMLAWYADVTAETSRAEAAESAEATARANADANLISGTVGMATGDEQGLTLHYSSTGYPYFGYSGGGDFLAWHSNVTAETSRAEAAEAAEATARANADAKLVSGFWNPTDTQVAALVFSGGNTSTVSAVSLQGHTIT
ncbi:hypothetical protein [Komagataeibacter kakiaceti]|uniref:hypothetical protein n=1 Tax=Komagataeibacter kakiaceti TaxID=943261 RepID=UPI000471A5CE|nr:hypothetical protein [Komagataeibacter kakiaceti]